MEKTLEGTHPGPADAWNHFCTRLSGRVSGRIERYLARLMVLEHARRENAGRMSGTRTAIQDFRREAFHQDEVRTLIGSATALADVWHFFLKRLKRRGPLDFLCLSLVEEAEASIVVRYLYTGDAETGIQPENARNDAPPGIAIRLSDAGNHLTQTCLRKDTTFSPRLEDLGGAFSAHIARFLGKANDPPAPFNLFTVPWIASGRVIGMLTLGFRKTDGFSRAGLSDVYLMREPIGQLVWSLVLQERLQMLTKNQEETTLSDISSDAFPLAGPINPDVPSPPSRSLIGILPVETETISRRETVHPANAEDVTLETIASLAGALEAKDRYTRGHSQAVANYAVSLARALRMTPVEVEEIRMAAFLHDIGKIGIPEAILGKAGPLNEKEWEIMKQHPVIGAQQILYPVASLRPIIPAVECHHENWDGSGHPHGYRGEKIPLGARIVSIVDAFHALTSDRAYRKALPSPEACRILQTGMGSKWDPYLMTVFFSVIETRRTEKIKLL